MRNTKRQPTTRVGLISLGCAKNLVDAEIMLGTLTREGMEITSAAERADVLIVNTCSFITAAQEESVDAILESAQLREARKPGQALVVAGCLPQRFKDELPKLLPEVDAFMGIDQVAEVGRVVREALRRRAERLAAEGPAAASARRQVLARLAFLEKAASQVNESAGQPLRTAMNKPRTAARRSVGDVKPDHGRNSGTIPVTPAPLVEVHARPQFIPDFAMPRFRLTPRHFAYVKIAEGCNHPCSFCIIPRMRGSHRSRPQNDVVAEAKRLLADGVKELNLISQDTTYYGLDLAGPRKGSLAAPARFRAATRALPASATTLVTLLRELDALPGDFWIRLLYTHPAHWTDELIETIARCRKVARYVDMPLQHVHDTMLERMQRETSGQYIRDLIARMRAGIPGLTLRTTFIVGFPGETEEHFETLLDFVRETRFERLGVFTYSPQDGTRAARLPDPVPESVKRKRRDRLMAVQQRIASELNAAQVGRTMRVLVERPARPEDLQEAGVSAWEHGQVRRRDRHPAELHGRYWVARGEGDAPDIDGRVYVHGRVAAGDFAEVRVVGHTDYDLIAEPV